MLVVDFDKKVITADNHVLETYRTCEEKYRLGLHEHWRPVAGAAPLAFGIAMHAGRAKFKQYMMTDVEKKVAVEEAVIHGLKVWDSEMPAEMKTEVMVDDKRGRKNFERLLRGYLEKYGGPEFWPVQVEVPGKQFLGTTPEGWIFNYVYTIDEIVKHRDRLYPLEFKTNGEMWPPNDVWFSQFHTKASITGYIWACEKHFGYDIGGAIIHAMWVHAEPKAGYKSKYTLPDYFKMDYTYRDDKQIEEWKQTTLLTGDDIVRSMREGRWRKDLGYSCNLFGGCAFKKVCGATPGVRPALLEMDFEKHEWDPWMHLET